MVKVALAEGHEEADALDAGQVLAEGLDLLMVQQVHILLANLIKVVLALDAHGRDLDPLAVLHVAAGGRDLAQVDLGVEVGGKGVAVVTAVAVQNVDRVDGIELMLGSVGAVGLSYARVKAAAQQGGQAGVLKLFLVGPLPAVVKVGGETGLLAALLVDGAPFRVIGVFRLVVGGVHVVDAAGKAGVHDGQILIGQGDVHDKVRLIGVDEVAELLHIIGIDLRCGDFGLCVRGQLGSEGIALGLGAAGDAQLGENIADLAALGDGDRCNAAAADNKNFAHDGTPLYFLLYDVYGYFVGANIVRPCLFEAAATFAVGYGIRPYILSPDKVENVGRGLDPSAGRRGRRSLQGWLLTFPVPAAILAAPCRP